MRARASILVGMLWCLSLLSIVVIGFLHTTRMDLQVGKNFGDRVQAHYLALAGIEKAKALLYHDARERSRSKQNHGGALYNSSEDFSNVRLGRGRFQVFRRGREDEGGGVIYGISDEESRLNLNSASNDQLGRLNGMTPDVLAAILDWRDGDNAVTPNGAETEYYASLQPPYKARNGPFQSVRELLMVRNMPRNLLLGNDSRQNGLLDTTEEGDREVFVNETTVDDDLGWAGLLTVNSSVRNVNAAGENRVNVQTANESALTGIRGITTDIARAIVAYRGQNQLQSIADLLDVTAPSPNQTQSTSTNRTSGGRTGGAGARGSQPAVTTTGSSGSSSSSSGRKVISQDLFMDIADDVTVSNDEQPGAININTANLAVLACLPGVSRETAQAIINYRQSSGFFPNTAHLLKVPGVSQSLFKQIAPRITARSETFRILSEGKIDSTGVRRRIQAVVRVGLNDLNILSWREDDL